MQNKIIAIAFLVGLGAQAGYASEHEANAKTRCDRRGTNISAGSWKNIVAREVKKLDAPLSTKNAAVIVQGVSNSYTKKLIEAELVNKLMGKQFQFNVNNDTPGVVFTFELYCIKDIIFPSVPNTGYNINTDLYELDSNGPVRLSFAPGSAGLEILVSTTVTNGSTILSKTSSIYHTKE